MKQNVLYRIFDNEGELLYVGITLSPINRLRSHRTKSWWPEAVTIRMEHFADREQLKAAERLAITSEAPRYNISLNGLPRATTYSLEEAAEQIFGDRSLESVRWVMRQVKKGRANSHRRKGELRMTNFDIQDLMDKCSNRRGLSDWLPEGEGVVG